MTIPITNRSRPQPPVHPVPASAPEPSPAGSLLDEAIALQDSLQDASSRANRLVASLRRNRRQSRLMEHTLQSLKQLGLMDG